MSATTLKLESPLLDDLKRVCPKGYSISAFVRSLLEQAIRRQKMSRALKDYQKFLSSHPDELEWLNDWESSELTVPPKSKGKKS